MKKYIAQLIQDIKAAHRHNTEIEEPDHELTFEEEMKIVENYATGSNIPPILGIQSGLIMEQFPPVEKLSVKEVGSIIEAFEEMLFSWNIIADIPENVPIERAYPLLVNLLNEDAWYFPGGHLHFDFCTGYAPDCELREFCPCLEIWNRNAKAGR